LISDDIFQRDDFASPLPHRQNCRITADFAGLFTRR
jgi:hypothetical protein